MSFSIPSACRPEMTRRPTISAALITPTTMISATDQASVLGASLLLDPLDRLADEQHDRDRRRLREDGEDRRDDQRALVRAQEAEQANEGAAVRNRACGRGRTHVSEPSRAKLALHVRHGLAEARAVRGVVQPAARAGGVGERDHDRVAVRVALADRVGQGRDAEQAPQREPADGDDQVGAQQLELPVAPELAEVLLARRRRSVAAAGGGTARDSSA